MRSSVGGTERFSNDKSIWTGNGRSGRSGARERARDSSSSLAGRPGRGSSQRKKAAYLTLGPAQGIIFHHPAEEEEVQRVIVSVGPLPHIPRPPFYLHLRSLPTTTSGTSGNFLSLRMVISENPTSTRRWTFPSVQVLTSVGSHWFRGNMKLNCATMAAWPFYRYISEHPRLVLASVSCIAQPTLVENYLLSYLLRYFCRRGRAADRSDTAKHDMTME